MLGNLFFSQCSFYYNFVLQERIQEYKRLNTLGHFFGIESSILSPSETLRHFPLLDPNNFTASLYSPGDGCIDPSMYCAALTKAAKANGGQVSYFYII